MTNKEELVKVARLTSQAEFINLLLPSDFQLLASFLGTPSEFWKMANSDGGWDSTYLDKWRTADEGGAQ